MILTDNATFLEEKFPRILEMLNQDLASIRSRSVEVMSTPNGSETVVINKGDTSFYLHSRYDPLKEAELLVEKYKDAEKYKHVFFYGVGLGFHVEALLKKHPQLKFTLYEPDSAVFYKYISTRSMSNLPLEKLNQIYLDCATGDFIRWLPHFVNKIKEDILIVVLPSYERKEPEKVRRFSESFIEAIKEEKTSLQVNSSFEKLWIVNSIMNLQRTLKNPNIFSKSQYFEGKPVILVAAGPSLEEEIDRLRTIKKEGLAYIFAAGSANKALIKYGIMPDALCTYDPLPWNFNVVQDIRDLKIQEIALIFGSTVGYKTLNHYPGNKFHMLISQDTVTPLFRKMSHIDQLNIISDAPSIAVVSLELLYKLKFDPIILVGQNLAFKNNQFYSKGIVYSYRDEKVIDEDVRGALLVKDVQGQPIKSNETFNSMRINMERIISGYHMKNVINTTQGGAHIEGTIFKPLEEVMSAYLVEKAVHVDAFTHETNPIDPEMMAQKLKRIEDEYLSFKELIWKFEKLFVKILQHLRYEKKSLLEKDFELLNEPLNKMENNLFYNHLVRPLNRVQQELLFREMDEIRKNTDTIAKANQILSSFGSYIANCKSDMEEVFRLLKEKTTL
ncbi:motility associated factor glycosyltransferase family protein [Paenibacillus hexagrammi]|uniref:DUF115 domain-containing protein n=1 Tax=Paenibacillus hexagrammi TaxID=2908839 RepID=A0ABY3SJR5_9BACL|nr:6-hydroxymethylpterin diphosphokinase MptE-like protein [Paenibacillus sp. YPD9-1]UJF33222.1 DUF115 domain-containing protein [Paenibacillus sp. YPD9-1]